MLSYSTTAEAGLGFAGAAGMLGPLPATGPYVTKSVSLTPRPLSGGHGRGIKSWTLVRNPRFRVFAGVIWHHLDDPDVNRPRPRFCDSVAATWVPYFSAKARSIT